MEVYNEGKDTTAEKKEEEKPDKLKDGSQEKASKE